MFIISIDSDDGIARIYFDRREVLIDLAYRQAGL
jgi:hypothetical protein